MEALTVYLNGCKAGRLFPHSVYATIAEGVVARMSQILLPRD